MDTWVQTGTTVTPHYDSLIAKLMVYAESRPAAIAKLQAALAETKVTHALRICHDWRMCCCGSSAATHICSRARAERGLVTSG